MASIKPARLTCHSYPSNRSAYTSTLYTLNTSRNCRLQYSQTSLGINSHDHTHSTHSSKSNQLISDSSTHLCTTSFTSVRYDQMANQWTVLPTGPQHCREVEGQFRSVFKRSFSFSPPDPTNCTTSWPHFPPANESTR